MKCVHCGYKEDKVVDSRSIKEGRAIRRRRECLECGKRFTTYEYIETVYLSIVKSDGRMEAYDKAKLMTSLYTACKKRPVTGSQIQDMVEEIEAKLTRLKKKQIPSRIIGESVMKALQAVDEVAYMRYASVYRNFSEVSEFLSEIQGLSIPPKTAPIIEGSKS